MKAADLDAEDGVTWYKAMTISNRKLLSWGTEDKRERRVLQNRMKDSTYGLGPPTVDPSEDASRPSASEPIPPQSAGPRTPRARGMPRDQEGVPIWMCPSREARHPVLEHHRPRAAARIPASISAWISTRSIVRVMRFLHLLDNAHPLPQAQSPYGTLGGLFNSSPASRYWPASIVTSRLLRLSLDLVSLPPLPSLCIPFAKISLAFLSHRATEHASHVSSQAVHLQHMCPLPVHPCRKCSYPGKSALALLRLAPVHPPAPIYLQRHHVQPSARKECRAREELSGRRRATY